METQTPNEGNETYLDRINAEYEALFDKIEKLTALVWDSKFDDKVKDRYDRLLLLMQREMMMRYAQVLNTRSILANTSDNATGFFSRSELLSPMSFGMAIEALKNGYAVRRLGWNGKGLYVFKQVPASIDKDVIPRMQSLPQQAKEIILQTTEHIDYTSQCLIFNSKTGRADSWVPSISDVFADDWQIAE